MRPALYFVGGLFLGATALSAPDESPQDPVKISPQYYTVRLENERVRVLEFRLKPGEREPTHSHPPGVVYVLGDATVRNTLPDGTRTDRTLKQGEVFWRERTTHTGENIGSTEARALAIDVKPCGQ